MYDHFPIWIWLPAMIIVWGALFWIWGYEAATRRYNRKALSEQDQGNREDRDQDGFG